MKESHSPRPGAFDGRPPSSTLDQAREVATQLAEGASASALAREYGVSVRDHLQHPQPCRYRQPRRRERPNAPPVGIIGGMTDQLPQPPDGYHCVRCGLDSRVCRPTPSSTGRCPVSTTRVIVCPDCMSTGQPAVDAIEVALLALADVPRTPADNMFEDPAAREAVMGVLASINGPGQLTRLSPTIPPAIRALRQAHSSPGAPPSPGGGLDAGDIEPLRLHVPDARRTVSEEPETGSDRDCLDDDHHRVFFLLLAVFTIGAFLPSCCGAAMF